MMILPVKGGHVIAEPEPDGTMFGLIGLGKEMLPEMRKICLEFH